MTPGEQVHLSGKPVIFRCDSSAEIGFGHMSRCLTLASACRTAGCQIRFVCKNYSENILADVGSLFPVHRLEPDLNWSEDLAGTLAVCRSVRTRADIPLLITDSHDFPEDYYIGLKREGLYVVSVDDYAGVRYASDILINHHINAHQYTFWITDSCRLLLGCQYLPLKEDFRRLIHSKPAGAKEIRIIVSLGGTPFIEQLLLVVAGIELCSKEYPIAVTVVPGYLDQDSISMLKDRFPGIKVPNPMDELAGLFHASDIAIVSGGVSCYEAAALGLPLVMIGMSQNQEDTVREFRETGTALVLPDIGRLAPQEVAMALTRIISDRQRMSALARKSRQLVDGLGTDRILCELDQLYKSVADHTTGRSNNIIPSFQPHREGRVDNSATQR